LNRMIEKGILPKGTKLTPLNPMPKGTFSASDSVRPWNTLSAEEKKLFSHMAEVFAGYSEYTDVQIGRVIDYLEQSGQLDNTLVIYAADNGASGEGSPEGSVNENKFFNAYPDNVKDNLAMMDKLGSPETYNHYPTGWAVAFSTPYKMFKRYSGYSGGTCDPLIISWPKGIKARGELRSQYYHCTDLMPTILEVCGVTMPEVVNGMKQQPLAGVSMVSSFDNANAPTKKETQYFEMVGTRGIWNNGWMAVAAHGPVPVNLGHFDQDVWELYHTDVDRSQSDNLAAQNPGKVEELKKLWMDQAQANHVLPLNDLDVPSFHKLEYHTEIPSNGWFVYYPGTTEIPEASAAPTLGRSFKILANVTLKPGVNGVIVAQGARFGGYTLFAKDGKINFVYNFLGIPPEQKLTAALPASGEHIIGVEFIKEKMSAKNETLGTMKLYVDGKVKAEAPFRTQAGHYALTGEGVCIGYDSGDPVSKSYNYRFPFTGEIQKVIYSVGNDSYADIENEFRVKMATQ